MSDNLQAFQLAQMRIQLEETEFRLKAARKCIDGMIAGRRRDLRLYRWGCVGLALLNVVFYGGWLADKAGWM